MSAGRRPLRLLAYTDSSQIGGAEIALATLLRALDPTTPVAVMGTDREVVDEVASARPGATTVVVPAIEGARDVAAFLAHRRAIAAAHADVFHANLTSPWSARYALLAATTVPRVATIAVAQLVLPLPTRRVRRLVRLVAGRVDALVAVGNASARDLEGDLGLPAGSVRTIHNAVDDVALEPVPRVSEACVVVTLARLDRVKGLDVLVHALAGLPAVHALVMGDGPERDALAALASRTGVEDRLHLQPWTPDARNHLGAADLFVLPSRAEGLPLSICEAMLAGLAVVATDVGSVREVVEDGVTGVVVPPDDAHALRGAIAGLLADPRRRTEYGRAGRERAVAQFCAPRMARDYEALYAEVAA